MVLVRRAPAAGRMDADPWEVLGVPSTATIQEARRAYAVRAQLLHPDKHPGAGEEVLASAQDAMSRLNAAWEAVENLVDRSGAAASGGRRPPPDMEDTIVILSRSLESAASALDLVRATRQLRETTVRSLLRRYDRARAAQLNTQLDEMLRHAEIRRSSARRVLAEMESRRGRSGTRRRLVRHHRLAARAHELAVRSHQHLVLAVPVDGLVSELETIIAEMGTVDDG